MSEIPILDTHQHLWDLERFRLLWLTGDSPLNRSYLPEDYNEATAGLGVERTIYMEVDVDPEQHVAESDYVVDLCKRGAPEGGPRMVAAVIGGRPDSPEFPDYLDRAARSAYVKGIRQVLHGSTPPGHCLRPEFVRGIRQLGERGLSFDLCMRASDLSDALRLVETCPGTRFILDHCGNPPLQSTDLSQWRADVSRLAACDNLVCKVSGIVASARPGDWSPADLAPVVLHVLAAFGPDRVMFGGDWPVCTLAATYRQWLEALRWIVRDRPLDEQRKLFCENSQRFYGVEA